MVSRNTRFDATDIDPRLEQSENLVACLRSKCCEQQKTIEQQAWRIKMLRGQLWRMRFRSVLVSVSLVIMGAVACYLCQLAFAARPF